MKKQPNVFSRIPPYRIVPCFLGDDLIERLIAYAIAKQTEFRPTKIGQFDKCLDPNIRVSRVLRDFDDLYEPLKIRFQEIKQQAILDLKLSPFELAHCEIELVAHEDGAFYKRHIDTATNRPEAKTQRIMTGVLYFHRLPKCFSGG